MRRKRAAAILAIGLASVSGTACGMTHSSQQPDRCRVIGGERLPLETGGERQICAAIEAAAAVSAPGKAYSVEVEVLSDSMLAARVQMGNGRALPEQKLAVSGRTLNRRSIERFANSVGEAIRRAAAE